LTFATDQRRRLFVDGDVVNSVLTQLLRAGARHHFAAIAYCFMPDHVHLIVAGETDDAECKAFIKAAKQYAGSSFGLSVPGIPAVQCGPASGIVRVFGGSCDLAPKGGSHA
jgi:hypothetical protein